jgi:hypothetical protein
MKTGWRFEETPQIWFSESCSSPNTPEAPISSTTKPSTVPRMPCCSAPVFVRIISITSAPSLPTKLLKLPDDLRAGGAALHRQAEQRKH